MTAAQKAARTREMRNQLKKQYGTTTYWVLSDIIAGRSTDDIAADNGIGYENVAAYRANLTRGTYAGLVDLCNFPV